MLQMALRHILILFILILITTMVNMIYLKRVLISCNSLKILCTLSVMHTAYFISLRQKREGEKERGRKRK
jgi:hypothetical protein